MIHKQEDFFQYVNVGRTPHQAGLVTGSHLALENIHWYLHDRMLIQSKPAYSDISLSLRYLTEILGGLRYIYRILNMALIHELG